MTFKPSQQARDTLASWFSRKPVFALMGEYSAGKSTLLNVLLGEDLLPTQVTATNMPAVWMTHGPSKKIEALDHDGALKELSEEEFAGGAAQGQLAIRVTAPIDVLKKSDILDTPGISDPRLATGMIAFLANYIDFALWCSAANQAWRQSEKALWSALDERLHEDSILVLTRVDKLRKPSDRDRVVRRCSTETADFFKVTCPISSVQALKAMALQTQAEQKAWTDSGAETLITQLDQSIARATELCEAREEIEVKAPAKPQEVATPKPQKSAEKPPKTVKKTDKKPSAKPAAAMSDFNAASALRKLVADAPELSTKEQIIDLFCHFKDNISGEKAVSEEHSKVLTTALVVNSISDNNFAKVFKQVEHEIADFAESAWCRLDQIGAGRIS